jgi:F-type H+-transporting ATPase subunit a
MTEQLWFTEILNKCFGGAVVTLLETVHVPPADAAAPIPNYVAMQILVFLLLVACFLLLRARLSVTAPGAGQHVVEVLREFVENQSREIIGHHSEGFTPFLMTLGLFILTSNLIGLVPGFESPTANPSVPLGCAVMAFAYYNLQGFLKQGVLPYLKHFMGPIGGAWYWIPLQALMLVIELISHSARMLSLTIRLYANIFAGDLVTLVFFSLIPIGVPVLFLMLHLGVSLLQSYIFVLLTTVYLQGAVATEH